MTTNNKNEPSAFRPLLHEIAVQLDLTAAKVCNEYCRFNYEAMAKTEGLSAREEDALNEQLYEEHCQHCPVLMLMRE